MTATRREFLKQTAGLAGFAVSGAFGPRRETVFAKGESENTLPRQVSASAFETRGVVLVPEDFTLSDWPERAARAGLTTLAVHHPHSPSAVVQFLEYAPIHRRYDIPYADQAGAEAPDALPALDRNLMVFPRETAQVLEYWLDASRFSKWRRPAEKLPWHRDVFISDLKTYAARGIRHVTTFAVWVDAEYVKTYGEPSFLTEYGAGFLQAVT
jgi:hypothetical protein